MHQDKASSFARIKLLVFALFSGLFIMWGTIYFLRSSAQHVRAAPIPPPQGYPKLSLSTKSVTPSLVHTGGSVLHYAIEILNTGAYTASGVTFSDAIPQNTRYNGDAHASSSPMPDYSNGMLTWGGTVGFDTSVEISFSVTVTPTFSGVIVNQARINHPLIAQPVTVTAETVVTDLPILSIKKSSTPPLPGANKPLTYQLTVTNRGQPANSLPVTVTDQRPLNTTLRRVGPNGIANPAGTVITWTRNVNLDTFATSTFTFSVNVNNVPSGTVLLNANYNVYSSQTGLVAGAPYTTTVVSPKLSISKIASPDPPGSNREMTYTLTVLNMGSLATNLVVQDQLPGGVTYRRGGSFANGVVSWTIPRLDTGQSARVSFTVYVGDIAELTVLNSTYSVCSAEGVCASGPPLGNLILGPTFRATASLDPIAKKPGGGTGPVTPTLTVENLGPGNAIDATARLSFKRISVHLSDLIAIPNRGTFSAGPICGESCLTYNWVGNLGIGEVITFTTLEGQSTIGGEEGVVYSATVRVTDRLGITTTQTVSATATGLVTHFAHLNPSKSAPSEIAAGQQMTYTLQIFNSGLSTDVPPNPWITDSVPLSTTVLSVSDNGTIVSIGNRTVVSWTLPAMSPGDIFNRSFRVQVDPNLISGTHIVNRDYRAYWFNLGHTGFFSSTGEAVTTTVRDIGLIDSFKTVNPTYVRPGQGNLLTYNVHVVNTSPMPLYGVTVYDLLPWQHSTYQRDAVASAGSLISDIVSINWSGNLGAYSSEAITFTVLVDSDFQGTITNTATIHHPTLLQDVVVHAVAYVTNKPVLRLSKIATPSPVAAGDELLYHLTLSNLGLQATGVVVSDTLPANVVYVAGSASSPGALVGNQIRWAFPVLTPGESKTLMFRVQVLSGSRVVNDRYRVTCAEGVTYSGPSVITPLTHPHFVVLLPVVRR